MAKYKCQAKNLINDFKKIRREKIKLHDIAIVGGLGNNVGAIVGGFVLGIVEELGAGLISSSYKNAIAFCILVIVLIIRPQGILFIRSGERV